MQPLKLAIVGHTNVGKTSLLRTLLQRRDFGQVAASPSTTRDVVVCEQPLSEELSWWLYDTPGLEQGSELFDVVEQRLLQQPHLRHQGSEQITQLFNDPEISLAFSQEAKVLRQLLQVDAAFYVIDVRDPVLPKFLDELSLLQRCGKPLIAVLNFIEARQQHGTAWRTALAQLAIHQQVSFDAVSPPLEGDSQLFESLAVVLPQYRRPLQQAAQQRQKQRQLWWRQGYRLIAELLVDAAAYQRLVKVSDDSAVAQAMLSMQQTIRQREQQTLSALLALYGFTDDDALASELSLQQGRWQDDLFASETLRAFGIKTGLGMAGGAAAGASVDLLLGGASLGGGALLGATVGGLYQGWQQWGKRWLQQWRGYHLLQVDDAVLLLLLRRQQQVMLALQRRGHAAQQPLQVCEAASDIPQWQVASLPVSLQQARAKPEWSQLNRQTYQASHGRDQLLADVQTQIHPRDC